MVDRLVKLAQGPLTFESAAVAIRAVVTVLRKMCEAAAGQEQAKKRRHEDVVVFLQEHGQGVVPRTHAATPTLPQPFIRCWRQHGPRNRTSPNKYKLFYAAMDGCLECVTRLVLREGVPTDVVSDTHKYAVSDYVEWGGNAWAQGQP